MDRTVGGWCRCRRHSDGLLWHYWKSRRAWRARRRGQLDVANGVMSHGVAGRRTLIHQVFVVRLECRCFRGDHYFQVTSIALIASATWIFWRLVDGRWYRVRMRACVCTRRHWFRHAPGRTHPGSSPFSLLVFWAILGNLGFNMSTALAGVGIGGLAIGFGAQKTIENCFGGVSVPGRRSISCGRCLPLRDRTGVVEQIGLRSTRIRTEDRTLLAF